MATTRMNVAHLWDASEWREEEESVNHMLINQVEACVYCMASNLCHSSWRTRQRTEIEGDEWQRTEDDMFRLIRRLLRHGADPSRRGPWRQTQASACEVFDQLTSALTGEEMLSGEAPAIKAASENTGAH